MKKRQFIYMSRPKVMYTQCPGKFLRRNCKLFLVWSCGIFVSTSQDWFWPPNKNFRTPIKVDGRTQKIVQVLWYCVYHNMVQEVLYTLELGGLWHFWASAPWLIGFSVTLLNNLKSKIKYISQWTYIYIYIQVHQSTRIKIIFPSANPIFELNCEELPADFWFSGFWNEFLKRVSEWADYFNPAKYISWIFQPNYGNISNKLTKRNALKKLLK